MNRAGLELFRVKSREELTQFNLFRDLSLVETQWEPFIAALRRPRSRGQLRGLVSRARQQDQGRFDKCQHGV